MAYTLTRRNELARQEGWTGYSQKRYWTTSGRLTDPSTVRRLADQCCGGHRSPQDRPGSLLCGHCNERVNPRDKTRPGTWKARLVNEAERRQKRSRASRKGWATRRRSAR